MGVSSRLLCPAIQHALHLERDSKLNKRQRERMPARIFSLKRGEEEVDLDQLEVPARMNNLDIVSVDDIFYLRRNLPMESAALGEMEVKSRWNFSSSNWRCWLK